MNTKEKQELSALIGQATSGDKAALETVLTSVQDFGIQSVPADAGHVP